MPNRRPQFQQSDSSQRSRSQHQQKGSPAHLYRSPGLKQQIHILSEEVSALSLRVQQQAEALQLQEDGAGDAFAELERRFQAAMVRMHKKYEKKFKAQAEEITKLRNELRRKQRRRDDVFKREDDARMDFLEARIDMISAELNGDEMVEAEMIEAEELAASRSQGRGVGSGGELHFDVDDVDGGAVAAVEGGHGPGRSILAAEKSEQVVIESRTESRLEAGTGQMKREDLSVSVGVKDNNAIVQSHRSKGNMKSLQEAQRSQPAGELPPPPPPPPAHLKGTPTIVSPPPPPAHPKPMPGKVASVKSRAGRWGEK